MTKNGLRVGEPQAELLLHHAADANEAGRKRKMKRRRDREEEDE